MDLPFAGLSGEPLNAPDLPFAPAASAMIASTGLAPIYYTITPADYTVEYMVELQNLVISQEVLARKGFVLKELTAEDLEQKKQCKNCRKSMKIHKWARNKESGEAESSLVSLKQKIPTAERWKLTDEQGNDRSAVYEHQLKISATMGKSFAPKERTTAQNSQLVSSTPAIKLGPVLRCKFHDGVKKYPQMNWSCCRKKFDEEGCSALEHHIPKEYEDGELESLWKFYHTPSLKSSNIRPAVAIDCEMGISLANNSELIQVSLVDFFTSEVLVNSLVRPDVRMKHYNTQYSGVTAEQMNYAIQNGQYLDGKKGAREAIWEFVGPNTIIVAHSAQNDLLALRWIHTVVVDTMLMDFLETEELRKKEAIKVGDEKAARMELKGVEKYTSGVKNNSENDPLIPKDASIQSAAGSSATDVKPKFDGKKPKKPKGGGTFSLKSMALVKLGRHIQTAGKLGHDSLEDAIASRDIAHWHVLNKPKKNQSTFCTDEERKENLVKEQKTSMTDELHPETTISPMVVVGAGALAPDVAAVPKVTSYQDFMENLGPEIRRRQQAHK